MKISKGSQLWILDDLVLDDMSTNKSTQPALMPSPNS
jgi:hypothetical protein